MYVYQITNLINNKLYIGITNNYKKRWQNHKCNKKMVIGKAIQKYGKVFKLVMPEVFTEKNKKVHSSLSQRGESNGRAKLKEQDVIEIRRLFKQGSTREEILEKFKNLKRPPLNAILRGETWAYLL